MLKMKTNTPAAMIHSVNLQDEESVLVCVTNQRSCENLIKAGAMLAKIKNLGLTVLSVQPRNSFKLADQSALEHLFHISMRYDAQMSVYYSGDALGTTDAFIRRNNISHIVMGEPSSKGLFARGLSLSHPELPVTYVPTPSVTAECV